MGGVHPDHFYDVLCGTMLLKATPPNSPLKELPLFTVQVCPIMSGNEQFECMVQEITDNKQK